MRLHVRLETKRNASAEKIEAMPVYIFFFAGQSRREKCDLSVWVCCAGVGACCVGVRLAYSSIIVRASRGGGGDAATEAHMGPRCCGALHCTAMRGAPTTAQNTDERAQKRIEGEPSAEGTTHIVQGGEPGGSHTRAKAQAHNAGQRRAGWSGPNSSVLWCGGAGRQCVRETSLWNREKMVWMGVDAGDGEAARRETKGCSSTRERE